MFEHVSYSGLMGSRFGALRTGPKLARRLAAVELGSLSDDAVLDYLHAEVRQLAAQQARVWRAMAEVRRRTAGAFSGEPIPEERLDDLAAAEIVAELRVSRTWAGRELDHALALEDLPELAAALRSGDIDRNRVVALLDVGQYLGDQHCHQLLDQVLPEAGSMAPAKLKARAQRIAIALDPDWARRRYDEAIKHKQVVCVIGDDGSVYYAGRNLPAAQALMAKAHVDALAKAAKNAGAHAPLDHLRADLFTGLLGTRFLGLTQREVVAELVKQYPKPPADEPAADEIAEPAIDEETVDAEKGDEGEPLIEDDSAAALAEVIELPVRTEPGPNRYDWRIEITDRVRQLSAADGPPVRPGDGRADLLGDPDPPPF